MDASCNAGATKNIHAFNYNDNNDDDRGEGIDNDKTMLTTICGAMLVFLFILPTASRVA